MTTDRFATLPEPVRLDDVITSQDAHPEDAEPAVAFDAWMTQSAFG